MSTSAAYYPKRNGDSDVIVTEDQRAIAGARCELRNVAEDETTRSAPAVNDRHTRLQQLKKDFDAAHEKGMESLARGDYNALTDAIQQERAIIEE
jgi:hypothetical protein